MKRLLRRPDAPLQAWEAVLPGLVLPILALWLGGSGWPERAVAASANLAPVAVLALLTFAAGRRLAAVQTTATLVYTAVALGWLAEGTQWDIGPLPLLAEQAPLLLPLVAAGCGVALFVIVALGVRVVAGSETLAQG